MKFMMLHTLDESVVPNDEQCGAPQDLEEWVTEMVARGIALDGARLHPASDATSVRRSDGKVTVTDGPFAETKEQIAGYDVIECDDLDAAIAVAAAHPTTRVGSIEVRAFDAGMPDPEVSEVVPEGKRRYLMLVCADMHGAMEREAAAAAGVQDAMPETVGPLPDEPVPGEAGQDEPDEVDVWIDQAAARRIYGWALEYPNRAVTVRRRDGRVVTTDGPFAETKEQIAGYDLLECDDLDDAIEVASGHPMSESGVLELRPVRA